MGLRSVPLVAEHTSEAEVFRTHFKMGLHAAVLGGTDTVTQEATYEKSASTVFRPAVLVHPGVVQSNLVLPRPTVLFS